jgi:hypothetical protein
MKKNYLFILLCCFNIILSAPASGLPVANKIITSFGTTKLYSFDVTHQDGKDLLQWNVSINPDLAEFQIERSDNGTQFNTVDSIYPKNVAGVVASYEFYSPFVVSGTRYYRLKIIYNDGSFDYSPTVTIDDATNNRVVMLYSSLKRFQLVTPYHLNLVNVVNASGQNLIRYTDVPAGTQTIDMDNFPAGVYWVQCLSGKNEVIKIMVN